MPVLNFDSAADAKALHKALKGFRIDEITLTNILCLRSRKQRMVRIELRLTNTCVFLS